MQMEDRPTDDAPPDPPSASGKSPTADSGVIKASDPDTPIQVFVDLSRSDRRFGFRPRGSKRK